MIDRYKDLFLWANFHLPVHCVPLGEFSFVSTGRFPVSPFQLLFFIVLTGGFAANTMGS